MSWKELEALLPHIFIISIVIFGLVSRILDYLKHKQKTELVLQLLVKDPNIDMALLKSITHTTAEPFTDLRRGILLIVMGAACLIFAHHMMDPEYKYALQGLSAFPGLTGLVYLIFHYLPKNQNNNESN